MAWFVAPGPDSALDNVVAVRPVDGGWSVISCLSDQPLMFVSGAAAEAKARSLAQVIARAGGDALVVIHDRRDVMVGTFRYFAEDSPAAEVTAPRAATDRIAAE
ncbi:MAG: hypothetical protein H2041_03725 [Phenylobacterium sp.]|jgi:hypothetical protein|uniref:hypothetical protein n=1 Tax=Phenylobacterium sp. TaxID=1871053 RepID=UPI0008C13F20|nr:hypothetical protein [Phenylobacterium sp.]MBA4792756.1 hypothetical protein [Phenylobacterium sp.]OHB33407.1 MAG: hypothetical protein A2882_14920 [Phenylobacterium sp. RIFCSPHIGHO2_01_FULL_70_10]